MEFFRVARLQNEIAPEKLFDTKKGLKNAREDSKNDPKVSEKFLAPLRPLKNIFHRRSSTFFDRQTFATKEKIVLQGWPR